MYEKNAHFYQCWQKLFIKPCWHFHYSYLEIKIMQISAQKKSNMGFRLSSLHSDLKRSAFTESHDYSALCQLQHKIIEMLNLKKTFRIIESSTAKPITKTHFPVPLFQTKVPALSKQISFWHWCNHVHNQKFLFRGLWKLFHKRENCHICLVPSSPGVQALCALTSQPLYLRHIHSLFPDFSLGFYPTNTNLQI